MKRYDKLVRDNIPSIIEAEGNVVLIDKLNDEQYLIELNKKIQEEMKEYIEDNNVEELADIVEVIYALLKLKGVSRKEFEQIRINKAKRNGRFDKRIYLRSVYEFI